MCCFYQTSNTINLVTATKYTAFGVMEYCVFVKDLVDCSATTHGVIFVQPIRERNVGRLRQLQTRSKDESQKQMIWDHCLHAWLDRLASPARVDWGYGSQADCAMGGLVRLYVLAIL